MSRRHVVAVGVALASFAVVLAQPLWIRTTGQEVTVAVRPIDPLSFFRGNYMDVRYGVDFEDGFIDIPAARGQAEPPVLELDTRDRPEPPEPAEPPDDRQPRDPPDPDDPRDDREPRDPADPPEPAEPADPGDDRPPPEGDRPNRATLEAPDWLEDDSWKRVFVRFAEGRPATPLGVTAERPDLGPGEFCVRARANRWQLDFPEIEQLFVTPERARIIESGMDDSVAVLRVTSSCRAQIIDIERR